MKFSVSYLCFLVTFCLLIITEGSGQDSLFRLNKTLNYPVRFFTVNNLGEIYTINANNQLKKTDDKGDSVGVFNMVTKYGKLSYIEAQNPWRTILYYKSFSTILLLDKY